MTNMILTLLSLVTFWLFLTMMEQSRRRASHWWNAHAMSPTGPPVEYRKFRTQVGDGVATSFTITHNLGQPKVSVTVCLASPPYEAIEVDVKDRTENTCTVVLTGLVPMPDQLDVAVSTVGHD